MALYNKALMLYLDENYEKAVENLDKANKAKADGKILVTKGIALMKMKKESEAKKAFEEAINTDKNNSHAYLGLGQCYYNEGDDKNAIKYYDEALKINPEFDNALCSKANALDHSKKKDEALKFYEQCNNGKGDQNALFLINNALCLYEKGEDADGVWRLVDRTDIDFTANQDKFDKSSKEFIQSKLKNLKEKKEKYQKK